jgi:hypothetical protein
MTREEIQGQFKHICNDVLNSIYYETVDSSTLDFSDYVPYFDSDEFITDTLATMIDENMIMEMDDAIDWLGNQANEERVKAVTDAATEYGVPELKTIDGFLKLIKQGEYYLTYNNLMDKHAIAYLAQAYALVYIQDKELFEKIKDTNELGELLSKIAESDVEIYEDAEKIVDSFIAEK